MEVPKEEKGSEQRIKTGISSTDFCNERFRCAIELAPE